jgi:aspartate-semialdehyde dehydrogenase
MTPSRDSSGHDVALYGTTGVLGREVKTNLEVEHEGIGRFTAVANNRSAGQEIRWRGVSSPVLGPLDVDASSVDFAILAIPADAASREAPRLLDAGARIIDLSGALAMPPLPRALKTPAPLVWPSLSSAKAVDWDLEVAVALPSATSSTLAPLLDALTAAASIGTLPQLASVDVTALLSASNAGREGVEALSRQAVGLLNYRPVVDPRPFPATLAFNNIAPPTEEVVVFADRTAAELRRLVPALGDARVEVFPIWVPAFSGLTLSVTLHFAAAVPPEALRKAIAAHPDLAFDMPEVDPPDEDPDTDALELEPVDGDDLDFDPDDAASVAAIASEPTLVPEGGLDLRGLLERGDVRASTPLISGTTARLVLMANPIERTALAATSLLVRWMAALDAD